MKLLWITDPHLSTPNASILRKFFEDINQCEPNAIAITGDIAEGHNIEDYLNLISTNIGCLNNGISVPIYFVLGNHDYYNSSIKEVRQRITRLSKDKNNDLHWMNSSGVISLTKDTAIIGHDGWSDGRNGDWDKSTVILNDYFFIKELSGSFNNRMPNNKLALKLQLEQLADESAEYLEKQCHKALAKHDHIIVLTHVPPFKDACWHEGQLSNWEWQPHFSNAIVGPKLVQIMIKHPSKSMTILCGHTHSSGIYKPIDNVIVKTGKARYGAPQVQEILDI